MADAPADGSARPHVFEVAGKWHAFDPVSGRFFRIDRVARDVLTQLPGRTPEAIADLLRRRHAREAVRSVLGEIAQRRRAGSLSSGPEPAREKPQPMPVEPRIVNLTLNVVSGCNLRCTYCWNQGGAYGRGAREGRMSVETARKAVDLMMRESRDKDELLVDFYGGEPLLNFEVLQATMDYCRRLEKETDRTFSFKVTTNGTLLSPRILEYFSGVDVSLGVSVDGTKPVQDRNRPFADGSGSWDTIRRNLQVAFETRNINISGRATLSPPNLDMVAAVKGLYRMGFRDTEVEFATESSTAFVPAGGLHLTERDLQEQRRQYLRFARYYLKHTLYRDDAIDTGLSNVVTRVLHEYRRFSPCGAGSHFITAAEDGTLYPCIGFIGMPAYCLGHVDTGIDLQRLASFRHQMRSVVHEARECAGCWARTICAGNCPANNEQHNRDIRRPYEQGCAWLKYQLEVGMWLASEMSERKPQRLEGYRPV